MCSPLLRTYVGLSKSFRVSSTQRRNPRPFALAVHTIRHFFSRHSSARERESVSFLPQDLKPRRTAMKTLIAVLALFVAVQCTAQESQQQKTPATLKSILLQQLRETHNQKNWFVSGKEAMAGLTPDQAAWNDGKNHSVGQLAQHLVFWNSQSLAQFK